MKQRSQYRKRRRKVFNGHLAKKCDTQQNVAGQPMEDEKSASAKKLEDITPMKLFKDSNITGYRLVDMEILANVFREFLCPSCKQANIQLTEKTIIIKQLFDV